MDFHKIKDVLNDIAPLNTQDEWDNSGVQVCNGTKDIKKVLIAMEINNEVIDEAIKNKVELIITHHPLIFNGIKTICPGNPIGEYIIKLIKNDITVYSCHTPFDKAKGGLNDYFLAGLGLKGIKQINEYVRVGTLPTKTKLSSFAKKVSSFTGCKDILRVVGDPNTEIKKVGICTGAGMEMYMEAMAAGADVYISGDIKHHDAWAAKESGLCLIDALHWGTERHFVDDIYEMLNKKLGSEVKLIKSKANQNPFDFTV